jgi:hypothetical protein
MCNCTCQWQLWFEADTRPNSSVGEICYYNEGWQFLFLLRYKYVSFRPFHCIETGNGLLQCIYTSNSHYFKNSKYASYQTRIQLYILVCGHLQNGSVIKEVICKTIIKKQNKQFITVIWRYIYHIIFAYVLLHTKPGCGWSIVDTVPLDRDYV